jgi:acyl carrier protein
MDALIDELKGKIIATLRLDRVKPADINADEPLFGGGLGLDSIDALELVAMLEQDYGIVVQDRPTADQAFASLRALAQFVSTRKPK